MVKNIIFIKQNQKLSEDILNNALFRDQEQRK